MSDGDQVSMLERFFRLVERLTWSRLLIGVSSAFCVVMLVYLWEHRDTVIPLLIGNTVVIIAASVAFALVAIGFVGSRLIERGDASIRELRAYMQDEIRELRAKTEVAERERGKMFSDLHEVSRREDECRANLSTFRRRMQRMEQTIRQNNLKVPANTGFGELDDGYDG